MIGNANLPVIRTCANPRTVRLQSEHIDVHSCGLRQREITLDQSRHKLLECMLRTANGERRQPKRLGVASSR